MHAQIKSCAQKAFTRVPSFFYMSKLYPGALYRTVSSLNPLSPNYMKPYIIAMIIIVHIHSRVSAKSENHARPPPAAAPWHAIQKHPGSHFISPFPNPLHGILQETRSMTIDNIGFANIRVLISFPHSPIPFVEYCEIPQSSSWNTAVD